MSSATGHRTSFRTDIQGLRAYAVMLVVLDHLFKWPSGGFVGVDVFYVISGFLITGLLIREGEETGGISFRAFYARRVKRILPAACVVLVVVVATAFLVWFQPRALQTLLDSLAALTFVENWHLIAVGANYLHDNDGLSPVQHYWSLAVEEQFYAVWPLAVLAAYRLRRGKRGVRMLVVALFVLSMFWSAHGTSAHPAAAYFDTFARGWELLAGAVVATFSTSRRSEVSRNVLGFVGFITIVASAFLLTAQSPFPFPGALLPVAGAVLLIWSAPYGSRLLSPLTNPVAQYVGRISFSIYLWHFPVTVFATSLLGEGVAVAVLALAVTLILSVLSYRFVESPFQKPGVLRRWSGQRFKVGSLPDLAVVIVTVAALSALTILQHSGPAWVRDASALSLAPRAAAAAVPLTSARLASELSAAASATAWPSAAVKALNGLDERQAAPAMQTSSPGCRNSVAETRPLECLYGDGSSAKTVLVVGDSVALSWVPAVERAVGPGWRIRAVGYANCSFTQAPALPRIADPTALTECAARQRDMAALIRTVHPNLLVVSTDEGAFDRLADRALGARRSGEWADSLRRSLDGVIGSVGAIVVLSNPPRGADPTNCANRLGGPRPCATQLESGYAEKAAAERAGVARVPRAVFIDTRSWFCSTTCPMFVGPTPVRFDGTHITGAMAITVSTSLREVLERTRVLR